MKSSTIENVSDTSFWVAYYRAKESEKDNSLFQDPLAKKLVGDRGQRISDSMPKVSQYTEWTVVSRTVIIDRFIEQMINEGVDVIINLGAGLDTRPYRMNLPQNLEWIEVDFPNIISHKSKILESEKPKCKLTRIELDLGDSEKRRIFLRTIAPDAKKVLVLTEGVIPYLSPDQVADLAKNLLAQPYFAYWIAEFLHPKVYPYLKDTARVLKMKNTPFLFFPDDWYGFFKMNGWDEKETRYSGEIAREFNRKPPMPAWFKLIWPFIPKKAKEASLKMTGFIIFKRANG